MLSGRLKAMKFMKRKEEAQVRRKLEKERNNKKKASHWTLNDEEESGGSLILVDDDDAYDNRFMLGRRSFMGFNPHIDRINQDALGELHGRRKGKSMSAKEMSQRYSKYVGMRGQSAQRYDRKKNRKRNSNGGSSERSNSRGKDNSKRQRKNLSKNKKGDANRQSDSQPKKFIRPKNVL